jgi:anti-sigma factor (TIGR02949 family)
MSQLDRYTCEEVFRRLDDYVDRELSPREMESVEEHLKICSMCAREYRFEESVIQQVRTKVQRLSVPSDLMKRISASLTAANEEPAGG